MDAKRKLIVGVNAFQQTDEKPLETLVLDDTVEKEQVTNLTHARRSATRRRYGGTWPKCAASAATTENLMPTLIEAATGCAVPSAK